MDIEAAKMDFNLYDGTLFGNDAGEDEIPDVLASYFVDQPSFSEFFDRRARLRVARSRKGMGKSALLSKLAFDLDRDLERPLIVRVTGANLIGIAKPENFEHLPLQNYWTKVICARVNYEIGKTVGFAFGDRNMALVESAEIAGFRERNIVGALISRIRSSKIPIETKISEYSNHEELLKRALSDESDRTVWVLVDDIDATYLDTPEQQAFVSTFFSACRSMVREVNNLFIRAVVRTDVWTNLRKNEDLDKAEQYITDISWSEPELKTILSKKIYAYMYRNHPTEVERLHLDYETDADQIVEYVFNRRVQWGRDRVPPFRPIQILSSGRPRWMSQLCRLAGQEAGKRKSPTIGIQEINAVLKRYTRLRLDDLYKEHSHQFADLQKLIETFSNRQARYPTGDLIATILTRYCQPVGSGNISAIDGYPYSEPMQLGHFLFKIGFIAGRREHKGHSQYAEFVRHDERPELLLDVRNPDDGLLWEIYPSYRNALGILSAGRAASARGKAIETRPKQGARPSRNAWRRPNASAR
jgi:hypothetical protein